MSVSLHTAVLVDEGMAPVIGVDPATGKKYFRHNRLYYGGHLRWMEWYSPSGETLLRVEYHPYYGFRIPVGNVDAVIAINPEFIDAETREQFSHATTEVFDCMWSVPAGVEDQLLSVVNEHNARILNGA